MQGKSFNYGPVVSEALVGVLSPGLVLPSFVKGLYLSLDFFGNGSPVLLGGLFVGFSGGQIFLKFYRAEEPQQGIPIEK